MIYTKNYLGKERIEDITFEDVFNYFQTEKQESDKIEYKSFSSKEEDSISKKEKGVIRSISAFLNSDGGLLIWGAPIGEKATNGKEKIFIGELSLVSHKYEKDQLISKITDSITPIPKGILFHRIEHTDEYIYIIEVPKSSYAPHQFDNRFYMRIDGQTKPAPYHYIEALFKQIKFPNINGYLKIENWNNSNGISYLDVSVLLFNHSKLQNDFNLSYRLICDIGKFQGWKNNYNTSNKSISMDGHEKRINNAKDIIHYGEPLINRHTLVFEDKDLRYNSGVIKLFLLFGSKNSPMKKSTYTIQADISRPKNYNDWITEMNENEFMGDIEDLDEQSKLKSILGR